MASKDPVQSTSICCSGLTKVSPMLKDKAEKKFKILVGPQRGHLHWEFLKEPWEGGSPPRAIQDPLTARGAGLD